MCAVASLPTDTGASSSDTFRGTQKGTISVGWLIWCHLFLNPTVIVVGVGRGRERLCMVLGSGSHSSAQKRPCSCSPRPWEPWSLSLPRDWGCTPVTQGCSELKGPWGRISCNCAGSWCILSWENVSHLEETNELPCWLQRSVPAWLMAVSVTGVALSHCLLPPVSFTTVMGGPGRGRRGPHCWPWDPLSFPSAYVPAITKHCSSFLGDFLSLVMPISSCDLFSRSSSNGLEKWIHMFQHLPSQLTALCGDGHICNNHNHAIILSGVDSAVSGGQSPGSKGGLV